MKTYVKWLQVRAVRVEDRVVMSGECFADGLKLRGGGHFGGSGRDDGCEWIGEKGLGFSV